MGTDHHFEENYLNVRRKEGRLYLDAEVSMLPEMGKDHPHHAEWQVRRRSCRRLVRYLKSKARQPQILEIGCGNGWLSNRLSSIPGSRVIGSDINLTELQQASRVFSGNPNLKFIYGDIRSGMLNDRKFNYIIFAASIQYFPNLADILRITLERLLPHGEIHILDSHFYRPSEIARAKRRTAIYYQALGHPEMADYYHHHLFRDLKFFKCRVVSSPASVKNMIFHRSPFPWVCVKKS